jgi:ATP-dependent DNA helicase RecG
VSLAIFDDRLEIANPGRLPFPLTPETIKEPHGSYPYNLRIAQVLYLSTNLERWGTGVSRMIELCREQGVPEPEYVTDGHEVKIVFRKKYTKDSDESKNVNVGSTVGSGGSLTVVQLTERQQKIVKLIKGNPLISSQQMSVVLSVVKRTIERDLAELQKKGVLRREGNTNAGKWVLLNTIKESFG